MSAEGTQVKLTFTVMHGEEECGVPWTQDVVVSEVLLVLRARFLDEIRFDKIESSGIISFKVVDQ